MNKSMVAALLATAALPGVARAQSAASDFTSATRYDALRRVTGTIAPDPDGPGPLHYAAVRNTYDDAGRVVRVETGELANWQSEIVSPSAWVGFTVLRQIDTTYDGMDRKLVERQSSQGTTYGVTQFSYDAVARLECTAVRMNPAGFSSLPASACTFVTPPAGVEPDRITRNVYDAAGQLVQVRRAVGTSLEQAYETYSYTPNGKREYVIDAVGNRARLTWDGMDRQAQWQFPSAAKPTGFDSSTPAQALNTAGAVNTGDYEAYGYDGNGNRTSLRKRDGRTLSFAYDALNRMTQKAVPDGCAPNQQGACPAAAATRDVFYSYDAWGRPTEAHFDAVTGSDKVLNGYDGFGRLTSTTTSMGGTSHTLAFQNDADGNRSQVQHSDGTTFVYAYDGLDRLSGIALNGGQIASIAYDSEGRRSGAARGAVTSTYGYTASTGSVDDYSGRLHSLADDLAGTSRDVTATFGYNPAGQIVSQSRDNDAYAYTGAYNMSVGYTANGLNQYTAVGAAAPTYDANGNLTSDGTTTYGYDAENRLVSSSAGASLVYDPLGRLWQIAGGSAGTTQFLYDGDQLTAEYDASGNLLRRYVHGTGEDNPLLWYEGSGLGDRRSLQADHQGSIVSVADASGNSVATNSYDEYGAPALGNQGRFQYTGQAWLPNLGFYYYKARMYAPKLGRFLQTDPVGYDDQVNLYAYVANDPVNGRDPTGELTGSLFDSVGGIRLSINGVDLQGAMMQAANEGPEGPRQSPGIGHNGGPPMEGAGAEGVGRGALRVLGRGAGVLGVIATDVLTPDPAGPAKEGIGGAVVSQGTRVSGNFPNTGKPGSILYRMTDKGQITSYQVYARDGMPRMRVDLTGSSHGGVSTPHTLMFERNVNPRTGQVFGRWASMPRPSTWLELP